MLADPLLLAALVAVAVPLAAFAQSGPTSQPAEDPAPGFIAQMDQAPPGKRPPNWEDVKKLMARRPPAVGEPAPDFTLKTRDGAQEITRSKYLPGRPQVLIFGSFT